MRGVVPIAVGIRNACARHGARTLLALGVVLAVVAGARVVRHVWVAPGSSTVPTVRFAGQPRPFVLVAFQPADCPGYADMIARWSEVARSGELPVIGVMLNAPADSAERRRVLAGLDLDFPVRFHVEGRTIRTLLRMGYDRTPISVLFDGAGRPRLVMTAPPTARAEIAAIRVTRNYARELLPPSDGR